MVTAYAWGAARLGFSLMLGGVGTNAENRVVNDSQMASFNAVEEQGGRVRLVWKGHPRCGDGFTVTAVLTPVPGCDGWDYSFETSGNRSDLNCVFVDFPTLAVPRNDSSELLLPRAIGQIWRPDWKSVKPGATVGAVRCNSVHFGALLNGDGADSWYVDWRGDARLRKVCHFGVRNGREPGTAQLFARTSTDYAPDVKPSSCGRMQTFRGGWFQAADIYRTWAREQPWAKAARARDRSRMRDIAIWFWNRGPESDVAVPVEKWVKETGLPTALDWYWWHAVPYDVDYPFFWPPREGAEAFSRAVRRLKKKGIFVQPYTNGVAWDVDDETWTGEVAEDACRSRDGTIPAVKYNVFMPSRLTVMCGTSEPFHRQIRSVERELFKAGVSGVYMDQIGGNVSRACFDERHGHPVGDVAAHAAGYRRLFDEVRADNPGILISTEDPSEACLDKVDSFISLWPNGERFGMKPLPHAETVPLFQAVHHDAVSVYGSYAVIDGIPPWDPKWDDTLRWQKEEAWTEIYPDQYCLEFARGVVIGQQPMTHQLRLSHFTDPAFAGNFRFTVDTARFYYANRDWLFDGVMCDPGRMSCATNVAKMLIRGIYTRDGDGRIITVPSKAVLHNVWRAPDGRVAAILCNWTREPQSYELDTPDLKAKGTLPPRSWKRVDADAFARDGLFRMDGAEIGFQMFAETYGSSNRTSRFVFTGGMKEKSVKREGRRTTVTWRGHAAMGPDFTVTVTLDAAADGKSWEYDLKWSGNTNGLPLSRVSFPVMRMPRSDSTKLFIPDSTGCVTEPNWSAIKPGGGAGGARPRGVHFIASFTPGGANWYLDQRGDARLRNSKLRVNKGVLPLTSVMASDWDMPAVPTPSGSLPCKGVIARLAGDTWFDAAEVYRAWAREQPWYKAAKARDLSRLREIGMWFWNRGPAERVIAPVERFQRETGVPCALDWYWWHDIPYDTSFPNFWPPREGEAAFKAAIARCRKAGIFLQVYTNGMTWDMDDPTWPEGGSGGVLTLNDGTPRAVAFNRFNHHRLAYMCGRADKYHARMRLLYRKLVEAGLPGIYLDMIANASYAPCFATTHGHVPGGGTYGIEGHREFVEAVRADNPGVLLSSEDVSEAYLDTFESGIVLTCNFERFGSGNDRRRYVPASSAVYHGCIAFFGSYAMVHGIPPFDEKWPTDGKWKVEQQWERLFPDQFAVEIARGVTWGLQPMVHNYLPELADDPRYAENCRLLADTAKFYHANREFLFDGEMLSPGKLRCANHRADFMIRGTYAREGEYRVCTRTNLASVLHGVWRAPDGRTAAVLFNWTREPQTYELDTPDLKAKGTLPPRTWRRVDAAPAAVEVRVRKTPSGPRIFVDGKPVRPRMFYGSPPSLATLTESHYTTFVYPFRATCSTTNGLYRIAKQPADEALFFKNARFVDMTTGVTNDWGLAEETRLDTFTASPLKFEKGHVYRFLVDVKAVRNRQFFTPGAFAVGADGRRTAMPLPYGDTLAETTRLAGEAGVDIITFGASSYGTTACWQPPGKEPDYAPLDNFCRRLVEANPNVLLLPRVSAEAPGWLLKKDPSLRMKFDRGFTLEFPSISARPYRKAACEYIERLTRHLREAFPRNFAGLHISGQNSGEWFYHLSQSTDLSGYDVHTRDAFRAWLAKRGEPDAATAEVPSPEARRDESHGVLRDPARDKRLLDFEQFRQEEVATFLSELGAAVRRGSDGHSLALFFYGYFWELGAVPAGASETGHYALQWLLEHGAGNVDGLSAPFSYSNRRWPGSSPVMSPAETVARAGILWVNEDDTRTYREDIWCYKASAGSGGDKWKTKEQTCDQLLRNAAQDILRGQGDWWMDLFGRGWYADSELWDLRMRMNRMDDALLARGKMVEPDVAVLVDERSFLYFGWGSRRMAGVLMRRWPFDLSGAPYGQYTLDDWLAHPTSAKICFVPVAFHLTGAQKARIAEIRAARPGLRFVWFALPGLDDGTAAEQRRPGDAVVTDHAKFNGYFVGEQARAAGARCIIPAGAGNVAAGDAFTMVQSIRGGDVDVDFVAPGEVFDYMTSKSLGNGPRLTLPFRKGETRVFERRPAKSGK